MLTSLKQETFLLLALVAALVAYPLEHVLLNSGQGVALGSGLGAATPTPPQRRSTMRLQLTPIGGTVVTERGRTVQQM